MNNKFLKVITLILILSFFSIFFSRYNYNYYENQNILTEQQIIEFEKDLKQNKTIDTNKYIKQQKDYNNKISKLGLKTSSLIEKSFKKTLKIIFKIIEKLDS